MKKQIIENIKKLININPEDSIEINPNYLEYFDEKRRDILYFAEKINSMVQEIADEKNLKNINKIIIEKR